MTIDRRQVLRMSAAAMLPGIGARDRSAPGEDVAETLRRQAQELADAVAPGDVAVWRRLLHEDCVYTNEDGDVVGKKELLEQLKPLPVGVTGTIRVTELRARVVGAVAVATYVLDENEEYHGHPLHCQYGVTDTWVRAPDGWRLLASQVLARRTDPPRMELPSAKLDDYCGRYLLAPDLSYEIRRRPGGLEGQRSGRPASELAVEAPDVLFSPGRPRYRYVFRRDPSGRVTGFAERREAWDLVWRKADPQS